jgi:hypothetical protein
LARKVAIFFHIKIKINVRLGPRTIFVTSSILRSKLAGMSNRVIHFEIPSDDADGHIHGIWQQEPAE